MLLPHLVLTQWLQAASGHQLRSKHIYMFSLYIEHIKVGRLRVMKKLGMIESLS